MTKIHRSKQSLWAWTCALVCALFVAAAVIYSRVTPIGDGQDEFSHLFYVVTLAKHLALIGPGIRERQQPPLYYGLAAIVYRLSGSPWITRLLTPLFGLVTLLLTLKVTRLLFPRSPWIAVGAVALAAAIPQFQWISGTITDDPLSIACSAGVILISLHLLLSPEWKSPSIRKALALGALAGITILSKETTYPLIVVMYGIALVTWWKSLRLPHLAIGTLVPLAIAGWWFVRNVFVFGSLLPHFSPIDNPTHVLLIITDTAELKAWVSLTIQSFLGWFGPKPTPLLILGNSSLPVRAFELFTGLTLICAVILSLDRWKGWSPVQRRAVLYGILVLVLSILTSLINSIRIDFQPQGRYLFVVLPLLAAGGAWTLHCLLRALPRPARYLLLTILILGAAILDIGGFATMAGPGRQNPLADNVPPATSPPPALAARVLAEVPTVTDRFNT